MMKMKDKQKAVCEYCENEGLIWVKNEAEGTSSMYRCPFCRKGKDHPMKEIPLPPKPVCSCPSHARKNY